MKATRAGSEKVKKKNFIIFWENRIKDKNGKSKEQVMK